jgi:hypothetical protein
MGSIEAARPATTLTKHPAVQWGTRKDVLHEAENGGDALLPLREWLIHVTTWWSGKVKQMMDCGWMNV